MKTYITIGVILLACVGGYFYLLTLREDTRDTTDPAHNQPPSDTLSTFSNEQYGYSFSYPTTLTLYQYSPEVVALGTGAGDAFSTTMEIQVAAAAADDPAADFNEFVTTSLRNYCAADGPQESIYCTDVAARTTYLTQSGLQGDELVFTRVHHAIPTNTDTTETYGPIYVFNISANVPGSAFTALIVRPAAALPTISIDPAALAAVADSLQINKITSPETRETLGDENLTLTLGESGILAGITITLEKIENDSRCSQGAQCIQAGSVEAQFTLKSGSTEKSVILKTNQSGSNFAGKTIAIATVTPEPVVGSTIDPKDYTVTLTVK